jgi:hypothetical protein
MYHTVDIQTLSPKQISRILNGHPVRVKLGSGPKMHVSTEHAKKLHRASLKGGASTVTLDPYAIEHNQHLRTHVGRIAHKARTGGTALIDQPFTARQAVNTTGDFIKNPGKKLGFGSTEYMLAEAVGKKLLGKGPKGLKKFEKWTGAIGDFLKPVAKPILDAGTEAAVRQIQNYGRGGRKGLPLHTGDGFFEDLGKVAKSAGKQVVKQIANEVVQYAGPAAGTAFAAAATAAGQPEFAPAAALVGHELGTRAGRYANKRIQGMGKRGGTALIDQPFTARQAVNTIDSFVKDPKGKLGFGVPRMLKKDRPKRVMSEAQKAALAKGRAALRIKLNEMGAGGAARPAGTY